ncbi:MAG TPA: rod shape-determining protein MreD [Pseudomonadales bacterium]|nr:rod shape-determining protein MreD [Pseudomonadales bacterium]
MLLNPDRYWWLMPTSLALAFFWQFWPLEQAVRQLAPDAVVMVMLYWALRRPEHLSSGWAFVVGLVIDGVAGTPLGMHALGMAVIIYIAQLLNERIRMFAIWQQSLVVGALYALYLLICDWALLLDPHSSNKHFLMLTAISTGLCWPACYLLLRQLEQGSFRRPVRS